MTEPTWSDANQCMWSILDQLNKIYTTLSKIYGKNPEFVSDVLKKHDQLLNIATEFEQSLNKSPLNTNHFKP